MVKTIELWKVLNSVKTVIAEKSVLVDDTLYEKLYTFLKYESILETNHKKSVLELIESSIDLSLDEYNGHEFGTNLLAKLRVCGSLLSDEQLFESQLKCLQFIKLLLNNIIVSNNSSLKFSYFKSLNDISCHRSGCDWILSSTVNNSSIKSFSDLLYNFVNRTESRFVEQEVRRLLIRLLDHSLVLLSECVESDCLQSFEHLFTQLITPLKPLSVEIIRESLVGLRLKREFIIKYEITTILINNIELWIKSFDEKVYYLCETLGLCVNDSQKAFIVIENLLKRNQLKPLIAFLTYFIGFDNSFSQKWLTYTMGSLLINSQLIHRFDLSITDKSFLESFSDKNINDYSLKQILKVDLNLFDANQIQLICDTLLEYIKLCQKSGPKRKTTVQTLSVLEKISLNSSLNNGLIEHLFAIYAELLTLLSNDLKFIVLKSLRILIENKNLPEKHIQESDAMNKLIDELNNILSKNALDDNNWEIIDSVLEVIYCVSLSHNSALFTSVCPQLIISVHSIWTTNRDDLCPTLRASLVSILIIIYLKVSKEELTKICVENNGDLQSLLSFLFNDELVVRTVIIKTLKDNISLLPNIEAQNSVLFNYIIETLCKVSIVDIDDDLQCNALDLLHNVFALLIAEDVFSHFITLFYYSGFFHILYHIVNSNCFLYKVKIKSVQIVDYIRDKFDSLYGKTISTTLRSIIPQNCSLTTSLGNTNVFSFNQINGLNSNTIFDFILNYDINSIKVNGSEDSPNLSVLDDILSVSQMDSDILIDCY